MRTHKHITSVTAGSMRAGPNFSWRFSRGKMMLTILGGLAEFERSLILARTADGVKRAKDRGVKFGRPPALTTYQR